ncbi:unnamed protein product [Penicillium salamii]|uniref:Mitochondrial division protein 1 n=1 Tax=Penicillium salamii TaxID=1612424 RepID=A0A9W4NSA0_9EURO|nr:unnamed protein product [Penicillium salamii]CAG8175985.1 unnamed protein product [Penicillium salamii]CAG8199188.1 unnamed protein product [Penicillium salamii]CAG8283082.1 unnamed protein product [Penicillium salamii]CAG8396204.1 unnamed protein product [Penicillium salamii]
MSGNVGMSFGSNYSGVQLGINNGNVNIQSHNVDILDKLLVARGAELDSYSDQHEDECLHGTRTDLLRNVAEWATSPDGKCIFWLNGMAGTGKSTIARTVVRFFPSEQFAAATFFFKRGEADRGNATRLFPTISRQLATKIPGMVPSLRNALTNDPDLGQKSLKMQFQGFLLQPLLDLDRLNSQMRMIFIIIDALDECHTDDDIRVILQLLPQLQDCRFLKMANHQYQDLALHDIPEEVTAHDISLFLKDRFWKIQDKKDVPTDWPGEDAIQILVDMSVPLFISAATVCRYVECKLDPVEELADLIKDQAKYSTKMDKTYLPVLVRLLGGHDEEEKDLTLQYFRQIVGSIILFADPLPVNAISRFLGIQERLISNLLDSFQSVLRLPSGRDQPVQILHQSFRDFLLQTRSQFYIDEGQTHKNIALHCLRTMRAKLKRDICNLNHYGTRRMKIDKRLINHHLQPELQYSCRHWVRHLEQCVDQSDIAQEALLFLQQHFLHWVEAMSTLGLASDVAMMINSLQMITQEVRGPTTLSNFLYDAKRFVLKFRQIANDVPLQLYCAGFVFAPFTSTVRQEFIHELPPWICQLPQVHHQWSVELKTLQGHLCAVNAVAFSPNGRFLASCSGSWAWSKGDIIQLWDAATGALRETLKGHSKAVTSLAFSPTGWLLASGSHDQSVRLWNPITGALIHTLKGHLTGVDVLAFSPCGSQLASGSAISEKGEVDNIRLWDTASGTLEKELRGNFGGVESLVFSANGSLLASGAGSWDFENGHISRIWNASAGTLEQTLKGHSGIITCVAFSSDGHLVGSGSEDSNVRIWDSATGALKQTLKPQHSAKVTSLAFSPNGRLLASGSFPLGDNEDGDVVRLWDPATGALLHTLQGHSSEIFSLAFSPDGRQLAAGFEDSTVLMWDPITNQLQPTFQGHQEWVSKLVVSPDGKLLASGSGDRTIRLWNSSTGALNHILEGHSEAISDIAFSPDSCLLASGSCDNTVRLWDSATGELRHVLVGQEHWVRISFSPDGFLLASRSVKSPIRIWDPMTGVLRQTLEYISSECHPIAFSPDKKLLASGSHRGGPPYGGSGIILWDLATGKKRQTLKGHSGEVSSVAFSPDGHLLASSSSGERTVRLWDPASGLLLQTFEACAHSLAFSPDSQILAFSSPRWTMQLLNLATGALKQSPALFQDPGDITFSRDGSYLSTNAGSFRVQSQCEKSTLDFPQPGFELYIDPECWICIDNERVLWLPVELRPTCCVVFDGKVAFGSHSGMVSVVGFCANLA